ncbi:MAG: HU family DNA-binding protein [Syntrophobacteraceae bacterium]
MSMKKLVLDSIHKEAKKIAEEKAIKPASKAQVAIIYRATWDVLRQVIMKHGGYRIAGFGIFGRRTHAPGKGRNPQTGEPFDVPEYDLVHFKPTEDFKKKLNKKLSDRKGKS